LEKENTRSVCTIDTNSEGKNPRTHDQDWTKPKNAKIKLKRTQSNHYLNQGTVVIGWKHQLVDYKKSRTRIIRMNITNK